MVVKGVEGVLDELPGTFLKLEIHAKRAKYNT